MIFQYILYRDVQSRVAREFSKTTFFGSESTGQSCRDARHEVSKLGSNAVVRKSGRMPDLAHFIPR